MNIIDAHVYLGTGAHLRQTSAELLARMDEAAVIAAIAAPVDRYLAVDNAAGNRLMLKAVARCSGRLFGMACANPWFGRKALREARQALQAGLSALVIHSVYQGFRLSDHLVDPLLGLAAEFQVPVYAHTGTAGIAEPFHVAELARRFPDVAFIMLHAGASDYYADAVSAMEYGANLWLETSRNGPANFCLFKNAGLTERLLFGSSAPEYIPAVEIQTLCDVFTTADEREAILSRNVRRVFRGKLNL
ncbi:MAG: amidohydrolase family protein [Verrucomicrobiota bacterium]